MTENTTKTNRLQKCLPRARVTRRRFMDWWNGRLAHHWAPEKKRGSVLVLVVGVLAVLAVMALSYVNVVRIDRRSTDAYQEQESLQQEVIAATTYIQSLLTADLFGNIQVNSATPRLDQFSTTFPRPSNLPKAFEDGEYSDYPWTDVNPNSPGNTLTNIPAAYTWDTRLRSTDPVNQSDRFILFPSDGERAYADDAWLAPVEPVDTGNASNENAEWDTWPQITNLLSAYSYSPTLSRQFNKSTFLRQTGRFADLGQLLLQRAPNAPNTGPRQGYPGADLTLDAPADQGGQPWRDPTTTNPQNQQNSPALGVNQRIFDLRMADLQEQFYWPTTGTPSNPPLQGDRGPVQPADERFWADTDGDGRPDARWQQLPVFGNAFEKIWLIAARIVDNSAQANVNAHINFMDYANPSQIDRIGDGRTPADIDLFRLIASQVFNAQGVDSTGATVPTAHPDITINNNNAFDFNNSPDVDSALEKSWQSILNTGLGVPNILKQLDDLNQDAATNPNNNFDLTLTTNFLYDAATPWPANPSPGALYGDPDFPPNQSNPQTIQPLELKRFERAHVWRYFGADPLHPTTTSGLPFPRTDEIDLRAYGAFNLLSFVSRLEQRLDATPANQPGFLPGLNPRYNDTAGGPTLGPLRSKEWDTLASSPRTTDRTQFILDNNFGNGDYTNKEQLERIRKDIRHLLTTVSGSGAIGPVPVLNHALEFERIFSTNKVDLGRFKSKPPETAPLTLDQLRPLITDTFAAAMWALAPLATNQPLMSPLDQIAPNTYAALAQDADLHYGGGVAGPASKVAQDQYNLTPNTAGPDAIGAAYAITRAVSLAVNIADAVDNQSGAASSTTTETPTLVRFFNQPNLDVFLATNPTARSSVLDTRSIALGTRFPQGDIWGNPQSPPTGAIVSGDPNALALPEEVVGKPENGVTFVGLDRQPFLVRALTVAVYADQGSYAGQESNANSTIDPAQEEEQLGSLFVIELGNPWPDPIDLAGYRVRIASSMSVDDIFELDFTASVIPDGATINAGQHTAFYAFQGPSGAAPVGAQTDWDEVEAQLRASIVALGGIDQVREVTTLAPGAPTSGGVMFQNVGAGPLPVLLIKSINGTTDVLVDRLSPPVGGDPFPAVLTNAIDLTAFNTSPPPGGSGIIPVFTGRAAVQSVLRRPTDNSSSGFPAYVIERPQDNITNFQDFDNTIEVWRTDPQPEPIIPIADMIPLIKDNVGGTSSVSEIDLIAQNAGSLNLPPFELFVPDGPLYAVSELGQISAFAHMYIHPDQQKPDVNFAYVNTGPIEAGTTGAPAHRWATVSEQLGFDAHYLYNNDPSGSPGGLNLNPYLGVLDPSRFILGAGGDLNSSSTAVGQLLPDALTTPLTTRLYDAFEAIPTPTSKSVNGLVNGRVNVNTAPRRILGLLPLVDPWDPFNATVPTIAGWVSSQAISDTRLDWLQRYRRRDQDIPGSADNRTDNAIPNAGVAPNVLGDSYTLLPGLRTTGNQAPWSLGLVNSGELTTMGLWSSAGDGLLDGQSSPTTGLATSPAFLELGANNQDNSGVPLDIRPLTNGFEAQDDPEERLAIFRAISNIVSTRSDVFTAWYIIRAYDPKDVEAITIPQQIQGDDNAVVSLMNPGNPNNLTGVSPENPGLLPTFEKRMLVIFDRSNVRSPTDRPKILLQVELPLN